MNTKAQSLRNGAWALFVLGLVLFIVGPTMMGSIDPFSSQAGLCLFVAGAVFMFAGLMYGGMSMMVREPKVAESIIPQAAPQQPYYPQA